MSSSWRAAIGAMRRMPVRGIGMRVTIAGFRTRVSARASRRSLYREEQDHVKTRARPTARKGYRLKDYVEALIAGGNWNNATNAGSRYRNANNYRWNPYTSIGSRLASDTGKQKLHLAGSFGLVSAGGQNTQRRFPIVSSESESCRKQLTT